MASRITQLRAALKSNSLDGILVTHLPHIQYLSGFAGSAGVLLVTAKKATLFSDFRYQQQMAEQVRDGVVGIVERDPYVRMIADKLVEPGMSIGFQDGYVSVAQHAGLKKAFKRVKLEPTGALVATITLVKTPEEIAHIKKAADIAGKVYRKVLEMAKPGLREMDIAAEISYMGRRMGADGDAFDIIVASGPRGALPHGRASERKIRKGEMVTLDFGFCVNGLNSDMTRTFSVGTPSDEARKVYDIVLEAQKRGVAAVRAGVTGKQVDAACRDHISAAGYGEMFGHSTGHGLGIQVHESPRLATSGGDDLLMPGMVVTIEPGIYLPESCGVRIEDDVVVTDGGCTVLTSAPKKLIIV